LKIPNSLHKVAISVVLALCSNLSNSAQQITPIQGAGTTYAIQEQDALQAIKQRSEQVDMAAYLKKQPRQSWSVWTGYPLPVATETTTRQYVPWYRLEFNITDGQDRILYPKGFTFNPLEHVNYPARIVVFKLSQIDQIKPLLKPSDILIADSGDVVEAARQQRRPIYILSDLFAKRFGVRVAPSFISQKGTYLNIEELQLEEVPLDG
jgi:conjugal transfer pilus assembly protein TraU